MVFINFILFRSTFSKENHKWSRQQLVDYSFSFIFILNPNMIKPLRVIQSMISSFFFLNTKAKFGPLRPKLANVHCCCGDFHRLPVSWPSQRLTWSVPRLGWRLPKRKSEHRQLAIYSQLLVAQKSLSLKGTPKILFWKYFM